MELGCCARMQQVGRGNLNLSEAPVQTDVLELDLRRYELRRRGGVLKLERGLIRSGARIPIGGSLLIAASKK